MITETRLKSHEEKGFPQWIENPDDQLSAAVRLVERELGGIVVD